MEINKLYNSDCIELIKMMPDLFIDKVITSPPYNINRRYNNYIDNVERNEFIDFQVNLFNNLERVIKPNGLILYNFSYGSKDPLLPFSLIENINNKTNFTITDTIVWKKINSMPLSNNRLSRICEHIYIFSKKSDINSYTINKASNNFIEAANNDGIDTPFNNSTFSTELVLKLLKIYSSPGELIYDPFMGIGTTIRAALIYDCNFIGSELDWRQTNYFNNKRLDAIKRKLKILKEYYKNILD
jgi:DNA modification methylase